MEAGTQSALLIIWVLFWMLTLSLLIVHPMFRPTRIQIRRSLRLSLHRGRTMRNRMRGRMLRCRGLFKLGLGRTLLWLARRLQNETPPPPWLRLPMRLGKHLVFFYLVVHLLFRQPMDWPTVLTFLGVWEMLDAIEGWWKRRRKRLQAAGSGGDSTVKSVCEPHVEP
jgi:hypothetical protein